MIKEFKIKIAGRIVQIKALYTQVCELCTDYICDTDESADICIKSSEKAIEYERKNNDSTDATDGYLETLSIYRAIAERMLAYSTILMHGAAVAYNGAAYMFSSKSGIGKTTRTDQFIKQIDGSFVVNGDKPLIRITDEGIYVCGTPWCGKENQNTNTIVPLRSIIILERSDKSYIREMSYKEAFIPILAQMYKPSSQELMVLSLTLLKKLENNVKFYKYGINLEDMNMKRLYEAVK